MTASGFSGGHVRVRRAQGARAGEYSPPPPQDHSSGWRGWHVILRFLPMVALGMLLIVIGISPRAPHLGPIRYGPLFFWLGIVLVAAAIIGMLFTKCPTCYRSYWVMCYMEPDVLPDHGITEYYRDLAPPEEEPLAAAESD